MPVPLIAAAMAAGAVRGIVGGIQNRNETRRKRGLINQAYTGGQQRMNVQQQDVREGMGESLVARGLAQGGDVQTGGAVSPGETLSVGGARTIGGQQTTDLHREQTLEQNDLLAQRDAALSDVNAAGTQGTIDAVSGGINTAMSVYGMGREMGAMRAAGSAAPSSAPATPAASHGVGTIRGAFGIDPITGVPQNPAYPRATNPALGSVMGTGQPNFAFQRMG